MTAPPDVSGDPRELLTGPLTPDSPIVGAPAKALGARQPEWVHDAYQAIANRRALATGKPCTKSDVVAEALVTFLSRYDRVAPHA